MIKILEMWWSNCFSYGENNYINFSENPLVQLIGKNGHGKTSISLILEECLYNKNSKGVKKADIINRYVTAKFYTIAVTFSKDNIIYKVETKRGSTQTVTLYAGDVDISSHTSTGTYKQIEDLLGMDHKTFVQIVVQSSASSLEFLTATDSNRKKFLIDLLSLNKYTELGEVFKAEAKVLEKQVTTLSSAIATTESWIAKNAAIDLTPKPAVDIPAQPNDKIQKVMQLKASIATIASTNKRIVQNNEYKVRMDRLVLEPMGDKPDTSCIATLTKKIGEYQQQQKDALAFVSKMNKLGTSCPTCMQQIDSDTVQKLVCEPTHLLSTIEESVAKLNAEISNLRKLDADWRAKASVAEEYERYHSLYDPTMPTTILDQAELEAEVSALELEIKSVKAQIDAATAANSSATAHNAKLEVIKSNLAEYRKELAEATAELAVASKAASNKHILVKTFSPSGLVAYKIECMIKDLENLSNEYLAELSSGRFQLSFKISGSDKLNVVITDNAKDIDILALSSGERARVNVATLLGIRKMLQALSNNRTNLLILDETIEHLDVEGKEKLIEVLLAEEHLNTVLVSHGFSHPLLEKVSIVKTNNISRIE